MAELGGLCTASSAVVLFQEVPSWYQHVPKSGWLVVTDEECTCAVGISRSAARAIRALGAGARAAWCVMAPLLYVSIYLPDTSYPPETTRRRWSPCRG